MDIDESYKWDLHYALKDGGEREILNRVAQATGLSIAAIEEVVKVYDICKKGWEREWRDKKVRRG
jgi:hypothetical protein